jgi:hypothetical protein
MQQLFIKNIVEKVLVATTFYFLQKNIFFTKKSIFWEFLKISDLRFFMRNGKFSFFEILKSVYIHKVIFHEG